MWITREKVIHIIHRENSKSGQPQDIEKVIHILSTLCG